MVLSGDQDDVDFEEESIEGEDSGSDNSEDADLAAYQRLKTTPMFSLSSIDGQQEKVLIEVENFGQLAYHQIIGLLPSGKEEALALNITKVRKSGK